MYVNTSYVEANTERTNVRTDNERINVVRTNAASKALVRSAYVLWHLSEKLKLQLNFVLSFVCTTLGVFTFFDMCQLEQNMLQQSLF